MDATWRQPRGATPAAAMDGALDTYWRPGALNEERSYWEVRYPEAIDLGNTVDLALLNRGTKTPTTIPLEITTANGTTTVDARDFAGGRRCRSRRGRPTSCVGTGRRLPAAAAGNPRDHPPPG